MKKEFWSDGFVIFFWMWFFSLIFLDELVYLNLLPVLYFFTALFISSYIVAKFRVWIARATKHKLKKLSKSNESAIQKNDIVVASQSTALSESIGNTVINDLTEGESFKKHRVGQDSFRNALLTKWNAKCAVTGFQGAEILRASHIVPWKDASNEERLDPENGILLSPILDTLFDKWLISFDSDGVIILSERLRKMEYSKLGIDSSMKLSQITEKMRYYLSRHVERLQELDLKNNLNP